MEEIEPSAEGLAYAQSRLMLVAVRALIESHPDAASFRESWAHALSLTMSDHMQGMAGHPDLIADSGAAFRKLLPVWEGFFPDSEAAKTKPKPGDTPPA